MSSSNKMTQLKLAAKDLLKTLQNAAKKPDDIKVAIVPFATDVNAGTGNVNASWIRWDEWEAEPVVLQSSKPSSWYTTQAGSSCPFTNSAHGFVCVTTAQGSTTASNIPSNGNYSGLICPSIDSGNKNSARNYTFYNGCYNSWTKCVGSACTCTTTDTSRCACSGSGSSKTCQTQIQLYRAYLASDEHERHLHARSQDERQCPLCNARPQHLDRLRHGPRSELTTSTTSPPTPTSSRRFMRPIRSAIARSQ